MDQAVAMSLNMSPICLTQLQSHVRIPTTPTCTWWNHPEEELSSGKLESTHPSRTIVKSIKFFFESSQSCAASLTHYSTEPLTTGPDFDLLLLLIALVGDVHPNPAPPRYPCSVCFKTITSQGTSYLCTRCSHWVHSRCSGLPNVWIIVEPKTGSVPPVGCHHSHAHLPHRLVPPHTSTTSDKAFNILQGNAMASATSRRN